MSSPTTSVDSTASAGGCCICLGGLDQPMLHLTCEHSVCISCGTQAAKHGLQSCPMCRAPTLLDVRALRAKLDEHRAGYKSWRQGGAKGAKGEPADISTPPSGVLHAEHGELHSPSVGLLATSRPVEPLPQDKTADLDSPATPAPTRAAAKPRTPLSAAAVDALFLPAPKSTKKNKKLTMWERYEQQDMERCVRGAPSLLDGGGSTAAILRHFSIAN